MKRLLMVVLVVGAAVIGGSYLATGHPPWVDHSPEEEAVARMRESFDRIRQAWREAGRAQSLGVDASAGAEDLPSQLEQLDREVADLAPRLKSVRTREQATLLRRDIALFRSEMR